MSHNQRSLSRALLSRASYGVLTLAAVAAFGSSAFAQEASTSSVDDVVVRGYRAGLQSALNLKRDSTVMVDAINAEDIADFPDANLAESLQRLPGVSIDRDNGEGRTITVRGLGPDFTRVRLNGLETVSTTGANDSGTSPNRGRGFDFNTFASELFSSLRVQKTASAETDEGSLGATVDLITGRAFDFKGRRLALSLQSDYNENGGTYSPRIAGLVSDTWFDRKVGATFSLAYNQRKTIIDSYLRGVGQSDFAYRGSSYAYPDLPSGTKNFPIRQGFAAPANAACNGGTVAAPVATAVVPGLNVTNTIACNTLRGSDPTAYALVMGTGTAIVHNGGTSTITNGNISSVVVDTPSSLVRIPALATLNQNNLDQDRLGMTLGFQVRPNDNTLISVDGVYSRFHSNSQNFQVSTIGLNRNNINAATGKTYLTTAGVATVAQGQAAYATCTPSNGSATTAPLDCGGTTLVPGTTRSFNPLNLDAYDYYNSPGSVFVKQAGYSNPTGIYGRDLLIGRPSTVIVDAALSPSGSNATYLKLGNLDMRSADDQGVNNTIFHQYGVNIEHDFTDRLHMVGVYGQSESDYKNQSYLVDLIRLDSGETVPGTSTLVNDSNGYFIYDERGGGSMPVMNFGADIANPAAWDTVKGYSAIRIFTRVADNKYSAGRLDFTYDLTDDVKLKFGLSRRVFGFYTNQFQRTSASETFNPTLLEAGSSVADVSRVINFGTGLDIPAGTTTSFIAPDNQKFIDLLGFDCNCVNKWGDWRISDRNNLANQFDVTETDTSGFLQLDFKSDWWGRKLFGNMGLRFANTDLQSDGFTNAGVAINAGNNYDSLLPSINLAYELQDGLQVRFGAAKVMARPLLGNLAPSVTAFSVPTGVGASTGGSLTVGNPRLAPFEATNFDLSLEWFFAPGGLLSVALFDKEVANFPQTVLTEGPLSSILDDDAIAALTSSQTNVNALNYLANNGLFTIRQYRNSPGGYIRGVELTYQQELTFLPGFLKNLGIQANYTHLESKLTYILRPEAPVVTGDASYTGASPDAFNFTVYYEAPKWSARVSTSYRAEYYTTYPIAAGTTAPGFSDSPLVNDFTGSKATTNVDANFSYKITPEIGLVIEAQNLTNQTSDRFSYTPDSVVQNYVATGRVYRAGIKFQY